MLELVVLQGAAVGVGVLFVHAARGDAVAEHLDHVARGHGFALHRGVAVALDVHPVLPVMAVAPLVVHPSLGVPLYSALSRVRATKSLVVPHTNHKLARRVLGQVVREALAVQTHAKAVAHHEQLVVGDGAEMPPCLLEGDASQVTHRKRLVDGMLLLRLTWHGHSLCTMGFVLCTHL